MKSLFKILMFITPSQNGNWHKFGSTCTAIFSNLSVLEAMNLRLTTQCVAHKTYKANHIICIVISWLLNSMLCLKQKDWPPHNSKGYSYKVIRKLIKIQVSLSIDAQMVQTKCFDHIAQWITLMMKTIFKLMDT